jgi:hypothetical protein
MKTTSTYRVFRGDETKQRHGHTGQPANPARWYYEPLDYVGAVLWSRPFDTEVEADEAAVQGLKYRTVRRREGS